MNQQNFLAKALSADAMKGIKGGYQPRRKMVCVLYGPMDVHCASVPASAQCEVFDYTAGVNGWMGCKDGSGEGYDILDHPC
jgi:hypothetical protein